MEGILAKICFMRKKDLNRLGSKFKSSIFCNLGSIFRISLYLYYYSIQFIHELFFVSVFLHRTFKKLWQQIGDNLDTFMNYPRLIGGMFVIRFSVCVSVCLSVYPGELRRRRGGEKFAVFELDELPNEMNEEDSSSIVDFPREVKSHILCLTLQPRLLKFLLCNR